MVALNIRKDVTGSVETWHGEAPAALAASASQIAEKIARSLVGETAFPESASSRPYDMQTLSHGVPGLIILHSEFDRRSPGCGWDANADKWIRILGENVERNGVISPSLFVGAAGHGLCTWLASRGGARYETYLKRVDIGVAQLTKKLVIEAAHRKGTCAVSDYDVVQGLAGIGRYLLHRAGCPHLEPLLGSVLDYLIGLSEPTSRNGIDAPGWYVPQNHQMTVEQANQFPEGSFNAGLAHGVAGPLALLSLAYLSGIQRPRQAQAITVMAEWLFQIAAPTAGTGMIWPAQIDWQTHACRIRAPLSERNAWCYGIPGIARSLFLAGQALKNQQLTDIALSSLRVYLQTAPVFALASGSTLCHGLAGILQITLRMGADCGDVDMLGAGHNMVSTLIERYDASRPFGYDVNEGSGDDTLGTAGFLNGGAGIALVLATYAGTRAPLWDSALLIS